MRIFPSTKKMLVGLALAMMPAIGATATSKVAPDLHPSQPSVFIENKGQWNKEVKFMAKTKGMNVWLTDKGLVYDVYRMERSGKEENALLAGDYPAPEKVRRTGQVIQMNFEGGNGIKPHGTGIRPEYHNYFLGKDPSRWASRVALYEQVVLDEVYQGVDAVLSLNQGAPRYDFVVSPGADPSKIAFSFSGANSVSVNGNNELVLGTVCGDLYNGRVYAYQENDGASKQVECFFSVRDNKVGFTLGAYDHSRPLVIDPVVYASYLGGESEDMLMSGAFARNGDLAVTGWTYSLDYPFTKGAYDTSYLYDADVVLSQVDPTTQTLRFSTFLGHVGNDRAYAITVDRNGAILICGETNSTEFPTTGNAYSRFYRSNVDAFLARFSEDGTTLQYSSYIGGVEADRAFAITLDKTDNPVITGETFSGGATTGFPITSNTFDITHNSNADIFITKFNLSTGTLIFSTFVGGGENDRGYDVALDANNNVYVTGETGSSSFPMPSTVGTVVYDRTHNGLADIFLAKFTADCRTLTWSTFIGGDQNDRARSMVIRSGGTIVLAGETSSGLKFPKGGTATGAPGSGIDAFIIQMSSNAQNMLMSRMIGGSGTDVVNSITTDVDGAVYAVGYTSSINFPVIGDAVQDKTGGQEDMFILRMTDADLIHSSYIGGKDKDRAQKLLLNAEKREVYIIGHSKSTGMASFDGVYQSEFQGGESDGYVGKYVFGTLELTAPVKGAQACAGSLLSIQWNGGGFDAPQTYNVFLKKGETWEKIGNNLNSSSLSYMIPTSTASGDQYAVRVVASSGFAVTSGLFTIGTAPKFLSQIQSATVCPGDSMTFTSNASGGSLSYKWRKDGTFISGATSPTLHIASFKDQDAGSYEVVVSNSCQSNVASQPFVVTVRPQTKITVQPQNTNAQTNSKVTLNVGASGANLAYEWQKDGVTLPNQTQPSLVLTNALESDNGVYRVIVRGACGSDTSAGATVNVGPNVSVTDENILPEIRLAGLSAQEARMNGTVYFPSAGDADIFVSDVLGNTVLSIYRGQVEQGERSIVLDMHGKASGLYYLIVRKGGNTITHKFVVAH